MWKLGRLFRGRSSAGERIPSRCPMRLEQLEPRRLLAAGPLITEFLASNHGGLLDEDGDSSDWLEIHNPTTEPIALDGWHLTDDPADLDAWTFPDIRLGAGDYLVIFASGKDRTDPAGALHTNFKIDADGEYLALVEADGLTVAHAYADPFPRQRIDIAYGIDPADPLAGPYYYTTPTPGSEHGTGLLGMVNDPVPSLEHGFHVGIQPLTLATDMPGATIRYTTDGSEPTPTHGSIYGQSLALRSTITFRAVAYADNYLPSDIVTRTYIFPYEVLQQSATGQPPLGWPEGPINGQLLDYGMDPTVISGQSEAVIESLLAIPTFSLATDIDNLMDPTTGIFVNAEQRGIEWERPVSVELIEPDGGPGFQIDAGVRIRGGYSRIDTNPKHAFRLFFRGDYDGPLVFPLFEAEGATEFHNIDLRTSQNYSWAYFGSDENSFTREVFSRDTQQAMDHETTRSRYYHLYINGQYWGLFQTQERPEADFAASYFGGDAEDYDVIKTSGIPGGYTIEATDGTMDAWSDLWDLAVAMDIHPTAYADNYWTMQGLHPDGTRDASLPVLLDVDNLIDYMLIIFYIGDTDAPMSSFVGEKPNNWYAIYDRAAQDEGFQFFAHDSEHSLATSGSINLGGYDRTGPYTPAHERTLEYSNPQFLHQHLMNHAEYRQRFADRAQKHLLGDGMLTAAASTARFMERVEQVRPAILAESARWGDAKREPAHGIAEWQAQVDEVVHYFIDRSEIVIGQLQADNLFPPMDAPLFVNREGQYIPADYPLVLDNPNGMGTIYYTTDGTDPRLIGGALNPTAAAYDPATATTTLVPAGSTWSYLDDGSDQGSPWSGVGFDDSAWSHGAAEFGYGDGDETTVVGYGGDPGNKHITTYFRTTFTVPDPASIAYLTIGLVRDDGAAVYINGQEVVRSNLDGMPGTPIGYRQLASAVAAGGDEAIFHAFEIDADRLVAGENTLAVEIHQVSASDSSDISFDLELVAQEPLHPIVLEQSGTVRARVRSGDTWSALAEEAFIVDTLPAGAANFRITEVNYHPPDPTAWERAVDPLLDDDDFEFIELCNVGDSRIDLRGVRFIQVDGSGIHFDFSGSSVLELNPGEFVLVVEDAAGFAIRYGTGLPVAGQWQGGLSNAGEQITLIDATGNTIHQFRYDDGSGWPETPDGDGPTLVVIDATGDYGVPSNWRASAEPLGTPGTAEFMTADFDTDGDVDGTDAHDWQTGFGTTTGAVRSDGDSDGDGDVDGTDFLNWQIQFAPAPVDQSAAKPFVAIQSEDPSRWDRARLIDTIHTLAQSTADRIDRSRGPQRVLCENPGLCDPIPTKSYQVSDASEQTTARQANVWTRSQDDAARWDGFDFPARRTRSNRRTSTDPETVDRAVSVYYLNSRKQRWLFA